MFGLFSSRTPDVTVIDKVWMHKEAKYKACYQMIQIEPAYQLVAWFRQTQIELNTFIQQQGGNEKVYLSSDANKLIEVSKIPVFVEHYPLASKEQALFASLGLKEVYIFSALDEPLFLQFGGERITSLMEKLGMLPYEEVSHNLISRSIWNAQKKIAKKIRSEQQADAQDAWFRINLPAK